MLSSLLFVSLAASTALAAINSAPVAASVLQARGVSLSRRQATNVTAIPTSSSALAMIINVITPSCTPECNFFVSDLATCARGTSQAAIATCACSSMTLGDIRSCAACVSADPATTRANSTTVVANYNAFVDLCIKDGLASVTGTVAVGASTSSVSQRPIATGSINANMTYIVIGAPTAASAAGLGASATGSANGTRSAGERTLVGSAVGLVLGAIVILA